MTLYKIHTMLVELDSYKLCSIQNFCQKVLDRRGHKKTPKPNGGNEIEMINLGSTLLLITNILEKLTPEEATRVINALIALTPTPDSDEQN